MEQSSYTPALRLAAWLVLAFGVAALVVSVIASAKMSTGGDGSPVALHPDTIIVLFGAAMFFQGFLLFALLMVVATMADTMETISRRVEKIADRISPIEQ
jgi:hypothetical protein